MARIAPGVFGRTAGPPDNGHGAFWAFVRRCRSLRSHRRDLLGHHGCRLPLPLRQSPSSRPPPRRRRHGPSTPQRARWPSGSATWARTMRGNSPTGPRRSSSTPMPANPDTPVDGYVRVAIPLGTVSTGQSYFDENVVQGDWFDVTKTPRPSSK